MATRTRSVFIRVVLMALSVHAIGVTGSVADPAPGEAWKSSPHHGVIDGATGKPIPCRCRFKDRDFRLGDSVCMSTHLGVVIARCDMILNNTTWAPTSEPCAVSTLMSTPAPRG
jgi:hypothetical protein